MYKGIAGQLVSSATTFLISIYLINKIGIYQFGLYSLYSAIAIFIAGGVSAFVATQMSVLARTFSDLDRRSYYRFMFNINTKICSLFLLLFIPIFFVLKFSLGFDNSLDVLFMALYAVGLAYRDFFIKLAYDSKSESYILYSAVGVFFVLAIFFFSVHIEKSSHAVFYVALSIIFGNLIFFILLFREFDMNKNDASFSICWKNGAHCFIAHVLSNLRGQGYVYLVGALHGPEGVGLVNTARTVMMPVGVFFPAAIQRLIPRMVEISTGAASEFLRHIKKFQVAIFSSSLFLMIISIIFFHLAKPHIGSKFQHIDAYIFLWAIIFLASSVRSVSEAALVASRSFVGQARVAGISVLVMALAITLGSWVSGLLGMLMGLLVSELVMWALTQQALASGLENK